MENQIPKPPIQKTEHVIPKKIGVVKTYAEDMANAMEHVQGSVIKEIIREQEHLGKEEENLSPESKKNKLLMIMSGILILATIIIIYLIVELGNKTNNVVPVQQSTSMIFTDTAQFLPIDNMTKDQIVQTIETEVSGTTVKSGGIEAIYLTENNKVIGFNRFATLLQINVPPEVLNYTNDNFLIGVYNGTSKTFFMLLKVNSFTDIFPGFKIWENKMFIDLHSLFGTAITVDTKDLLTKDFTDTIVGNKNARTLTDKNGNVILEYVYANDSSVVIIANDETANEIMLRLSTGNIAK